MANGGRKGVANPRLTNGAPTQQSLTASGPQGGVKPSMAGGMTQMGGGMTQMGGGRGMPMRGMTMAPPMREEVNPGGGLMQSLKVDQLPTGSPIERAPPPPISDAEKMASGYDFKHLQRVQDTYGPGSTSDAEKMASGYDFIASGYGTRRDSNCAWSATGHTACRTASDD